MVLFAYGESSFRPMTPRDSSDTLQMQNRRQMWKESKMDAIAAIAVMVVGIVVGGSILFHRARERAEYEDVVSTRLARYAGRQR